MIVIEDISSRKAVQAALQQSEERFRLALEGAKEGVWDWRPQTDEFLFLPGLEGDAGLCRRRNRKPRERLAPCH